MHVGVIMLPLCGIYMFVCFLYKHLCESGNLCEPGNYMTSVAVHGAAAGHGEWHSAALTQGVHRSLKSLKFDVKTLQIPSYIYSCL